MKYISILFITLLVNSLITINAKVKFSKKLSSDQTKVLKNDLRTLKKMKFKKEVNADTLKILDIKDFQTKTVNKWLNDRVKYIMEQMSSSKFISQLTVVKNNYIFENNAKKQKKITINDGSANLSIVISNLGATIYRQLGKPQKKLFGFNFKTKNGQKERIDFVSPRVGLLKIGKDLFENNLSLYKGKKMPLSTTLYRLSVLFHEARHSDGHGDHLVFPHTKCPKGHDYYGKTVCDNFKNGAYAVGASMLKEFLKNCNECTIKEIENLKLKIAEWENRIIVSNLSYPDDYMTREDTILQLKVKSLKRKRNSAKKERKIEIREEIKKLNAEILLLKSYNLQWKEPEMVPTFFLDPAPEGKI